MAKALIVFSMNRAAQNAIIRRQAPFDDLYQHAGIRHAHGFIGETVEMPRLQVWQGNNSSIDLQSWSGRNSFHSGV
jgi:hypothetical protein